MIEGTYQFRTSKGRVTIRVGPPDPAIHITKGRRHLYALRLTTQAALLEASDGTLWIQISFKKFSPLDACLPAEYPLQPCV